MWLHILYAAVVAIIPIIWIWLNEKLNGVLKDKKELQLLFKLYGPIKAEIEEISAVVAKQFSEQIKDGKISEAEKQELIALIKKESKESWNELVEKLAPEISMIIISKLMASKISL